MKQKEKIILGLIALLCGSLMILFSLRNNKQKNNLSIKKEEKNEVLLFKEKHQQSSSSFLFLTVLIILLFVVLIIIFYVIYRSWQNSKEDKLLKCTFYFDSRGYHIHFLKGPDQQIEQTINNILTKDIEDFNKLKLFPKITDKDSKALEETLKKIIVALANFLSTYLTSQLLTDVYQEWGKTKKKGGILTEMAIKFADNAQQVIYTEYLEFSELQKEPRQQKITVADLNYISQNKPLELLKIVMNRQCLTFIEDKNKVKNFLFLRTFKFYEFIETLYFFYLKDFMSAHKKQYKNILKSCQTAIQKINKIYN